jgi:pimeloyl-ACP methyl ester carboxylesterase
MAQSLPLILVPGLLCSARLHAPQIAALWPDAFVRQQMAIMSRPDSRSLLASIRCPTLVLVGDEGTPPELNNEIAGGIAGAKFTLVPDCGHLSTIEKPEAVNAALAEWPSV